MEETTPKKILNNDNIEGLFECHITVENSGTVDHQEQFLSFCQELKVKPVLIELPEGVFPTQLMTSTYFRGLFPEVKTQMTEMTQRFIKKGFAVSSTSRFFH
jgi:hypothetical protein